MKKGLIFCLILALVVGLFYVVVFNKGLKITGVHPSLEKKQNTGTNLVVDVVEPINPSFNDFLFKVYGRKKGNLYGASKIELYKTGDKQELLQTITFKETTTSDKVNLGLKIADMNFDGYKDFQIQQLLPATSANTSYYYWLWDPQTGKYIPDEKLTAIPDPQFDEQTKTIKSFVIENALTNYENTYQYLNGVPVITKQVKIVTDLKKELSHISVFELKGNNMTLTKQYDEKINNEVF